MNTNGHHRGKTPNVAASVSDLTHDVIELSELQVQLVQLDARQSMERARTCVIMAVVGAAILLGTIPVALLTIAALLVEQLQWSYAAATAVATGVGLVLAGIVLAIAYGYVKNGLLSFDRSREELRRNIAWLKSTLRTRGRARKSAAYAAEHPVNY